MFRFLPPPKKHTGKSPWGPSTPLFEDEPRRATPLEKLQERRFNVLGKIWDLLYDGELPREWVRIRTDEEMMPHINAGTPREVKYEELVLTLRLAQNSQGFYVAEYREGYIYNEDIGREMSVREAPLDITVGGMTERTFVGDSLEHQEAVVLLLEQLHADIQHRVDRDRRLTLQSMRSHTRA